MKINKELLIYTKIKSWNQDWEISSNLGEKGYYSPSLISLNPLINFEADNSTWIIEDFLPNLKILLTYKESKDLSNTLIHEAIKFELEELSDIPKENYKIIVDLIEQAIELGFFREHYDKSK